MKVVETRSRKWFNPKFKNSLSFSTKTRNFLGLFMFLFLRKWNLIEIVSTRTHHITSFHFKELEFYLVWYYYYISMVISPLRIRQTIPFSHLNYASSWLIFEEEKIQFNVNVYRFCCWYLFKRNECKQTPLQQWQPQKNRNSVYVCVCVWWEWELIIKIAVERKLSRRQWPFACAHCWHRWESRKKSAFD